MDNDNAAKLSDERRLPDSSTTYRVVVIGFGLLLTALMIGFLWQQSRSIYGVVRPVQGFADSIKHNGMKAGAPTKAPDGVVETVGTPYSLDVGGEPIYLITFDDGDQKQRDELRAIRHGQPVTVSGKPRSAAINGDLVMVGHDGRSDEEKLVRAFEDFNK